MTRAKHANNVTPFLIESTPLLKFLEPTPLSDEIHSQHITNQKQRLLLIQQGQQQCKERGLSDDVEERCRKRKSTDRMQVRFSTERSIH